MFCVGLVGEKQISTFSICFQVEGFAWMVILVMSFISLFNLIYFLSVVYCVVDGLFTVCVDCVDFDIICQNFYTASSLQYLLHNIHPKRIISFIHATALTNKLFNYFRQEMAAICVLRML